MHTVDNYRANDNRIISLYHHYCISTIVSLIKLQIKPPNLYTTLQYPYNNTHTIIIHHPSFLLIFMFSNSLLPHYLLLANSYIGQLITGFKHFELQILSSNRIITLLAKKKKKDLRKWHH